MAPCCNGPHRCTNASKCGISSHFSSVGEALVQACLLLFFSKCRQVFIIIIKISLFCILQYISNISIMRHELVQHGQQVYNLRPRWRLPEMQLGGTSRAAALHHLLNLVHKRGSICAFKGVFPPLAPQRSTALPTSTPAFTFQARYFLCCLTGGITLLLLIIISYPFPSTRNF